MIVYGYPYQRRSVWSDLREWARVQALCWLVLVGVVGYSAAVWFAVFLAVRAAL